MSLQNEVARRVAAERVRVARATRPRWRETSVNRERRRDVMTEAATQPLFEGLCRLLGLRYHIVATNYSYEDWLIADLKLNSPLLATAEFLELPDDQKQVRRREILRGVYDQMLPRNRAYQKLALLVSKMTSRLEQLALGIGGSFEARIKLAEVNFWMSETFLGWRLPTPGRPQQERVTSPACIEIWFAVEERYVFYLTFEANPVYDLDINLVSGLGKQRLAFAQFRNDVLLARRVMDAYRNPL